jgi:WD40 repeat protein
LSRLFISHSSKNDDRAIALRDWLVREGWSGPDDIFLDLDPERGIAAGQKWVRSLEDAATRCEAVLFLVSEDWLASKWCGDEYQLANRLNKKLFALLIDDVALDRLPGGLTAQWQIVRLKGEPAERFLTVHPLTQRQSPVHIAEAGLKSLKRGLQQAGIGAETFELQPDQNGPFGWRAPYRGLEALEPEDAAVFFGRNADIVRGIDELRGLAARKPPRLLVVLGASGAGKSSFLRAGLWPRLLRDDSQWLPLRAIRAGRGGAIEGSEGLLAALEDVHRRFGLQAIRADLRDRLTTPQSFVALLHELRKAAAKRALISEPPYTLPVICLDQGEEVFTGSAAPESERLLQLSRGAIDADAALLLVTIRSDSYGSMQSAKAFGGIHQESLSLEPVPHGEIAHVIRGPAELLRRKAGPTAPLFDAAVIERLQQEIEGEEDALPLLAFVLQRLMREYQGMPTIGLAELDRTGGVAAAIESAAEAALDDAGVGRNRARQRNALRRLFIPRLARIDRNSKAPQRRVARQSELPADLLSLAQALTQRRLLVVKVAAQAESGTTTDAATIEVAHEALLRRWPTLADLLAEDRAALLLLDGVLSAAADWDKADAEHKPDYFAHRGSRLAEAQALASRGPDWEREIVPARAYIAACMERETADSVAKEAALRREQAQVARTRKLQTRATWALAAVFAIVVAALVGVLRQSYQTSEREAAVFANVGATAFQQGFCDRALRLALAGLPPAKGAFPISFRSPELLDDLSLFGSTHHDCHLQMALMGHAGWVTSAVFSPDGTRIVTASRDGTARLWDATTGATLVTLVGHTDAVLFAAFSPDGSRVVTASDDTTARLWDAKTGAQLATLPGHIGSVISAAFSPDGTRVVTVCLPENAARLWDANTGAALATLVGHTGAVNRAAFSRDGRRIVTASDDNTARLWDGSTGATLAILSGHTDHVNDARFSPDGTRVVTASQDGTARLWEGKTGTSLITLKGEIPGILGSMNSATFSPDGSRIVAGTSAHDAFVWDANTGAVLTRVDTGGRVNAAEFSPDGTRVVTASGDVQDRGGEMAKLWDATTGIELATLSGNDRFEQSAAFSPDGMHVLTVSSIDDVARLWDAKTGTVPVILQPGGINSAVFSANGARVLVDGIMQAELLDAKNGASVATLSDRILDSVQSLAGLSFTESMAVSADGKRIVTASNDNTARLWDGSTGAPLAILSGHTGHVNNARFSPDGTRVVTASEDNTARIWNAETGAQVVTLTGHSDGVTSAEFSPDGTRVVTASQDDTARLWDAETGAALTTLSGHTDTVRSAMFSADGSRVVTASADNTARLWDTTTGKVLATLRHIGPVRGAMFSPDGARIVTWSREEDTAHLWDGSTGAAIAALTGHTKWVNSAAFSPDSKLIATTSGDGTVRLWDGKSGAALAVPSQLPFDSVSSAEFSPDGRRVVTTSAILQVDQVTVAPADQRQNIICRDRLVGAELFTDMEMQDAILRGREDLRNPCDRVGPLSLAYYWRAAEGLVVTMRNAIVHR